MFGEDLLTGEIKNFNNHYKKLEADIFKDNNKIVMSN